MDVQEFIERYNLESKWNAEIISIDFFEEKSYVKEYFKLILGSEGITEVSCDFSTARVYEKGDPENHYYELQIYSYIYGTTHFWIHPDMDERTYKANRIRIVMKHVAKIYKENDEKMREAMRNISELNEMTKMLMEARI